MEGSTVRQSSGAFYDFAMAEPVFGYTQNGATPHRPSFKEVLSECADSINITKDLNRGLIALNLLFYIGTGVSLAYYVFNYVSLSSLSFVVVAFVFIGTVYNTVWYHRYCSHAAFKFSRSQ